MQDTDTAPAKFGADWLTDADVRAAIEMIHEVTGTDLISGDRATRKEDRTWCYHTLVQAAAILQASVPPSRNTLTDAEIDALAESMPGGLDGFLKGWGWRQFARALLAGTADKRKPLTDDEMVSAARAAGFRVVTLAESDQVLRMTRAIEAAHGIKEGPCAN